MLGIDEYDPYRRPSPYELLGIDGGVKATSKDIAKAFNKQKNEARLIKDVKQRVARLDELEKIKDQLQRPEDRVLFDFFVLGSDLFGDLCDSLSQKLAETPLPCAQVVGRLLKDGEHDDLIPRPLTQFTGEFQAFDPPDWYQEEDPATQRVPIANVDIELAPRVPSAKASSDRMPPTRNPA